MRLKNLLKQYMPAQDQLDDVTYRMIAIGWPLLTGGIITGAVWANSAWGTYWGWDPKETWSLITWFIYAIYLHARYVRGWKGTQMAVISAVGFLAVIFTYLGVNLVLSGLHSYGGMN
jgi:cytochrome c-type biogenesis protein CcsB